MAKETNTARETKAQTPNDSDLRALTAVFPIEHDGVRYEPGQTLVVGERDAAALIAVGAALAVESSPENA